MVPSPAQVLRPVHRPPHRRGARGQRLRLRPRPPRRQHHRRVRGELRAGRGQGQRRDRRGHRVARRRGSEDGLLPRDRVQQRDVVQDGAAGMAELIRTVLGEKIDKSPEVRLSQWSSKTLTEEQIICDVCCQTCLLAS